MKLAKQSFKYFWWLIPVLAGAVIVVALLIVFDHASAPVVPKTQSETKTSTASKTEIKVPTPKTPVVPTFDKQKYSTTDPASIWVVVNKQHPLTPISFVSNDLITTVGATISAKAQADFEAMNNAALAQGVNFSIVSSYLSYGSQSAIYNNYVASYGQAETDTFSARAGYSEHQTGLAIDFGSSTEATCNLDNCFGSTVEGQWLATHANDYGFILRYTAEKQSVTGYKSEPWHYRYVGRELAGEMKKQSISTLEEFFGISGGDIYS